MLSFSKSADIFSKRRSTVLTLPLPWLHQHMLVVRGTGLSIILRCLWLWTMEVEQKRQKSDGKMYFCCKMYFAP